MNGPMRKSALRRYLVFRVKAMEMLDLNVLHQAAISGKLEVPNPGSRLPKDFAASLHAPLLGWFALVLDKQEVDVMQLWSELFPKHRKEIDSAWEHIQPASDIVREFRDRAGFHTDKPRPFFLARHQVIANQQMLATALEEFWKLFAMLLEAEADELPDLEREVDEFLDAVQSELRVEYDRLELKRYLKIRASSPGLSTVEGNS